jgi:hypothetical protein
MMMRTILVAAAALASVGHAEAANAPWCAAINVGTGNVYWDCQYSSFDDCYTFGRRVPVSAVPVALRVSPGPSQCRNYRN